MLNDDYTPMEFVVEVLEVFLVWIVKRLLASCWRYTHKERLSAASILEMLPKLRRLKSIIVLEIMNIPAV